MKPLQKSLVVLSFLSISACGARTGLETATPICEPRQDLICGEMRMGQIHAGASEALGRYNLISNELLRNRLGTATVISLSKTNSRCANRDLVENITLDDRFRYSIVVGEVGVSALTIQTSALSRETSLFFAQSVCTHDPLLQYCTPAQYVVSGTGTYPIHVDYYNLIFGDSFGFNLEQIGNSEGPAHIQLSIYSSRHRFAQGVEHIRMREGTFILIPELARTKFEVIHIDPERETVTLNIEYCSNVRI